MQLISVNIGKAQLINAKSGKSGIFKQPVTTPVDITRLGLVGDEIIDTENHGGLDQAVYVFGTPDYGWWAKELGREMPPGIFGENLTITELESQHYQIGDRLRVGEVLLEVTSPRIPCVTLAARMGDPKFVKRFAKAERYGLYCRVIEPGTVQVGDSVSVIRYRGETITALEMFRLFYNQQYTIEVVQKALAAPLHQGTRRDYEEILMALEADAEDGI
jgi:MOSC domain-containing protein YiiM